MIFQVTVLGPILWNIFYADSATALQKHGYTEIIYADDLNGFKKYSRQVPDATLLEEGKSTQQSLHAWGHTIDVNLTPGKRASIF